MRRLKPCLRHRLAHVEDRPGTRVVGRLPAEHVGRVGGRRGRIVDRRDERRTVRAHGVAAHAFAGVELHGLRAGSGRHARDVPNADSAAVARRLRCGPVVDRAAQAGRGDRPGDRHGRRGRHRRAVVARQDHLQGIARAAVRGGDAVPDRLIDAPLRGRRGRAGRRKRRRRVDVVRVRVFLELQAVHVARVRAARRRRPHDERRREAEREDGLVVGIQNRSHRRVRRHDAGVVESGCHGRRNGAEVSLRDDDVQRRDRLATSEDGVERSRPAVGARGRERDRGTDGRRCQIRTVELDRRGHDGLHRPVRHRSLELKGDRLRVAPVEGERRLRRIELQTRREDRGGRPIVARHHEASAAGVGRVSRATCPCIAVDDGALRVGRAPARGPDGRYRHGTRKKPPAQTSADARVSSRHKERH